MARMTQAVELGPAEAVAAESLAGGPPEHVAVFPPAPLVRKRRLSFQALLTLACRLIVPPRIWFFYLVSLSLSMLRAVFRVVGLAPRGTAEEILYVVRNGLSILYAIENARLLSERGTAKCAVTALPWLRRRILDQAREANLPLRYTPLPVAVLARWPLVVHTHHYLGFCFDRATPSVYISHGIETGKKTLYDASYTYGCQGLRTPREPLYRTMIATHVAELGMAGRAYPCYRDVVTTSTEAVLERLIARAAERESIKARLGIPWDRPVALFMSTWGRSSLLSSHGLELAREAPSLAGDFHLVLVVHPKRIRSPGRQAVLKTLQASGIRVISPPASWIDYMAVADVAVSDITSLCLYSVLVGLPVVFLGAALERLIPHGPVEELVHRSPRASTPRELKRRLQEALRHPNTTAAGALRSQFPHLGDADHLVRTMKALVAGPDVPGAARHA